MVDAGKVARSGMGEISSLRVVASRRVALALAGALLLSFVTLARPASAAAHLSPSAVSPSVTTCTTFLEEGTAGNPQQLGYAFGRIWMTETAGTTGYLEGLDPLSLSMLQFVLPGPDAFDGSGMDVPLGVVGGPDLRVWFVGGYGQGYARVGRIDPAISGGAYSFINLPTGSGPTHIVYAPLDGAFWISASGSDSIIRLTPSGAFTVYPLTPGTLPWGITVGGDGAIWFAERGSGKIGRMLTTGVVTDEVSVGGDPRNIATGSGAVWFTKFGSAMVGKVDVLTKVATQLPTPTAASGPDGVTVDPAGAVWFTESSVGKVARIDPGTFPAGGSVTETSITVSTPQPGAMAALADGTVWFTENAPFIAHFKPAGDGSVLPLPPVVDLSISGATTTVGLDTIYSTSTTFGVSSTSIACVNSVSYRFYLTGTPEASKPAYTTITGASASFNLPSNGTWYIDYYATGPGGTIAAVTAGPFIVDDTAFPDLVPPVLTVADVTVTATGPLTPVTLAVSAIDAVDGVVPVYCAPASPYPPGVTLVTCSASDVAGNTATKTLTVTVVVPPPTLTVPTSVSVVATATLTPVPIPATASSVVDGAIFLVTCSGAGLTPGSAFTPGVVTVYAPFGDSIATCSISDAHGNTTSHAVAIHVAAPPPTMTLPADMTVTTFRTDGRQLLGHRSGGQRRERDVHGHGGALALPGRDRDALVQRDRSRIEWWCEPHRDLRRRRGEFHELERDLARRRRDAGGRLHPRQRRREGAQRRDHAGAADRADADRGPILGSSRAVHDRDGDIHQHEDLQGRRDAASGCVRRWHRDQRRQDRRHDHARHVLPARRRPDDLGGARTWHRRVLLQHALDAEETDLRSDRPERRSRGVARGHAHR